MEAPPRLVGENSARSIPSLSCLFICYPDTSNAIQYSTVLYIHAGGGMYDKSACCSFESRPGVTLAPQKKITARFAFVTLQQFGVEVVYALHLASLHQLLSLSNRKQPRQYNTAQNNTQSYLKETDLEYARSGRAQRYITTSRSCSSGLFGLGRPGTQRNLNWP